jgi:hypothetical protein
MDEQHSIVSAEHESQMFERARLYSRGEFVPAHFRNKPENALIAVNIANRVGMDPYMVMKGLYNVHGTLAMTGSLMIALVNKSGEWGPITYQINRDGDGKILGCTASAKHLRTEVVADVEVTREMVQKEGWARNQKWASIPEQMFRYRAAAFWARLYSPESLFGLHTVDEVGEMQYTAEIVPDESGAADLNAQLEEGDDD